MRTSSAPESIQSKTAWLRASSSSRVRMYAQAGAREEERPLLIEDLRIDGRDRAAGLAVEHHVAARLQAIEALVEGGLAHRVIDDLDARAAGEPFDLGLEVGLRVEDDLVGAS